MLYRRRFRRSPSAPQPAKCPRCRVVLKKPKHLEDGFTPAGFTGGRCKCGAVYVVDDSGKRGGEALLDGLALFCGGDLERALALNSKVDYRTRTLAYDPSRHSYIKRDEPIQRSTRPKIWFILPIDDDDSEE